MLNQKPVHQDDYYVQDVEFPSGYIPYQSPVRLSCVGAIGGFAPPNPKHFFTYVDLGCGKGITLNSLAAANPHAEFFGIDFNERHIAKAVDFAEKAGLTNVHYIEADFRDLSSLELPTAQYIAMNGIYSWLHPEVIDSILVYLRGGLTQDGLFYVQTMTMPGKTAIAPVWHLLRELSRELENPFERVELGLGFLEDLLHNNAAYFTTHSSAAGIVKKFAGEKGIKDTQKNLVHHALSDNWRPLYFTDLAKEMERAGLSYAGSARFENNDTMLCLPRVLQNMLTQVQGTEVKELIKDFMLNTQKRFDVFARSQPDEARALAFLANDIFFLRRQPKTLKKLGLQRNGRRVELPIVGTPYEQILTEHSVPPLNLKSNGGSDTKEVNIDLKRHANRLLATRSCFVCIRPEIHKVEKAGHPRIANKANALMVERAIEEWRRVDLLSECTGEACISLLPLEALVIKAYCKGTDGIVSYVEEFLASRQNRARSAATEFYQAPEATSQKKLTAMVERTINGGKLRNLFRLGMLLP